MRIRLKLFDTRLTLFISQSVPTEALVNNYVPLDIMDGCVSLPVSVTTRSIIM